MGVRIGYGAAPELSWREIKRAQIMALGSILEQNLPEGDTLQTLDPVEPGVEQTPQNIRKASPRNEAHAALVEAGWAYERSRVDGFTPWKDWVIEKKTGAAITAVLNYVETRRLEKWLTTKSEETHMKLSRPATEPR